MSYLTLSILICCSPCILCHRRISKMLLRSSLLSVVRSAKKCPLKAKYHPKRCDVTKKNISLCYFLRRALMAELVDALISGVSIRKDVQVRVLFGALFTRISSTFDLSVVLGIFYSLFSNIFAPITARLTVSPWHCGI